MWHSADKTCDIETYDSETHDNETWDTEICVTFATDTQTSDM